MLLLSFYPIEDVFDLLLAFLKHILRTMVHGIKYFSNGHSYKETWDIPFAKVVIKDSLKAFDNFKIKQKSA